MTQHASDTCKQLIALLNNAKELSVDHSNRTLSIDTIQSCTTLCKSRNFGIKDGIIDVLESLIYAIKSYKPEVLLEEFQKAEEFVVMADMSDSKSTGPKIPVLPYADMNEPSSLI